MAHDTPPPSSSGRPEGQPRGQRSAGNRDSGGFRIRLSDNEMAAARALQEAFGLRSTVAVLGFSLRTLAQQLEQGALAELIAQHRAQGEGRPPRPQGRRDPEARTGRSEERGHQRGPRIDPFARPSRPATPASEPASEQEPAAELALEQPAEPLQDEAPAAQPEAVTQSTPEPESAADAGAAVTAEA